MPLANKKKIDVQVEEKRASLEPEWQKEYQRLGNGYSRRAAFLIMFSYPFGVFADIAMVQQEKIWFFLVISFIPTAVISITLIIRRFFPFRHEYLFLVMCFSLFLSASHRVENQDLVYYIFNNALCFAGAAILNVVSPLYPIIVFLYAVMVNVLVEKFFYNQDLGFYFGRSGGIILTVIGIFFVLAAQLRYRIMRNNYLNGLALTLSYQLLEQKNKIIEENSRLLKQKNDDITASIAYAQRIQNAILPLEVNIQRALPEHFILFKPRDVVSGDFYWFAEIYEQDGVAERIETYPHNFVTEPKTAEATNKTQEGNYQIDSEGIGEEVPSLETRNTPIVPNRIPSKVIITAVDCTGHGVPGAFMSMLGSEALDNIVLQKEIHEADKILQELNRQIRLVLKQEETKNQDGMDIALCVIDFDNRRLEFAGAHNPLVYIQNGEAHVIRGSKIGIGGNQSRNLSKKEPTQYEKHIINLDVPTTFYIYSDGFQDQFGGENGKKFMSNKLKELLLKIHQEPMSWQKKILEKTFADWIEGHQQIDDVLIIGVRIG